MAKNIVICCDGTSNHFGSNNTHVVRLAESAETDTSRQLVYYDAGVGTLPEPGLANPVKWAKWKLWTIADLAVGWGLEEHVVGAYRFLMRAWEPGDRVFLFGFSRGAYTVRVTAGLLHALGLLRSENEQLIPYLLSMYKSIDSGFCRSEAKKKAAWDLCDDFRRTFSRVAGVDKRFPIHFLGLWDTVSSYGWLWNPRSYLYTANNSTVSIVRHAVAIDESRAFFRQNLIGKYKQPGDPPGGTDEPPGDIDQRWFPGMHGDIGGGYREDDGGLWRVTFRWMLNEAIVAGLHIDQNKLTSVLSRSTKPSAPWDELMHSSLLCAPQWWIAEFIPKVNPVNHVIRINLFRARIIMPGAIIDRSALERIRDRPDYRPRNMTARFFQSVINLEMVPDKLPYAP